MIKRLILFLVAAGLLAAAVPAAQADPTDELSIEDNHVLYDNPADAINTVPKWKALGVDTVRISARWSRLAPKPNSKTKPAGFNAANPNKGYNWGELDFAIGVLNKNGIAPTILIPQDGPLWASELPSKKDPSYKPSVKEFTDFAKAVVTRYKSKGVKRYLLGNEPNQSFFLKPQLECKGKTCTDFAPSRYRQMINSAYPAVKRIEPGAKFLIGELAPIGSTVRNSRSSLKPLAFLRGMACVDKTYKPLTVKDNPNCAGFKAAKGDGFSFHPYQVKLPPAAKQKDPDLVKLGDLPKLFAALDKTTSKHRLISTTGKFNVYLTEFGYETNPPDKKFGVTPALQAAYLQQGAYIAFDTPRVKLFSQYVWRDEKNADGFASGLVFSNDVAKPSLNSFANPFFYDSTKKRFWGQVRPGGATNVQIVQVVGNSVTRVAGPIRTDSHGNFTSSIPVVRGRQYNFQYVNAANKAVTSSAVIP